MEQNKTPVFDWEGFKEEDFQKYHEDLKNGYLTQSSYIGECRLGELSFDLMMHEIEHNNKPVLVLGFDVYVGGVDSGYGYSGADAMKKYGYKSKYDVPQDELYPYDHVGCGNFEDNAYFMEYTELKKTAEKKFCEFLDASNKEIKEKAAMPLHRW